MEYDSISVEIKYKKIVSLDDHYRYLWPLSIENVHKPEDIISNSFEW